ncbi:hypothetical protein ILYODFUR_003446 [Ilyodon furcidens]|uniref:Uncharacterized protein n=1 Tax=Ilyodon furcidens TaxID=33524 RepID=A0ABV0TFN2_9TELE
MMLESTAVMLSPREDPHTVLIKDQPVAQVKQPIRAKIRGPGLTLNTVFLPQPDLKAELQKASSLFSKPIRAEQQFCLLKPVNNFQVVVEAVFTQKPSMAVKIFIIIVSLVLGLTILAAFIWCLWKVGFFKRSFKKQEELNRDSWDYVPKLNKKESTI